MRCRVNHLTYLYLLNKTLLTNSVSDQQNDNPIPGPSGLQQKVNNSQLSTFSPKDLRLLPQAGTRTETNKGRKNAKLPY